MARPKKNNVESIKDDSLEAAEATISNPAKVYNKFAYAIFEKDGSHHLVEFPFNTDTLESAKGVILESNEDEFEIEYALEEAISNMLYD